MQETIGKTGDRGRSAFRRTAVAYGSMVWLLAGLMLTPTAPAQADTLPDILAKTYETNPSLAAARAALRATNERVPQALANWGLVGRLVGAIGSGTEEPRGAARSQRSGVSEPFRSHEIDRETAR